MPTLTAPELEDIRLTIGDDGTPQLLSDVKLQEYYDAAESDLTLTYVYALRRLWGIQRRVADRTTPHGDNENQSQIRDATKALLDYYENMAGIYGNNGGLFAGVIDLDLDRDYTDTDDTSLV